jgi:hypothetical protein
MEEETFVKSAVKRVKSFVTEAAPLTASDLSLALADLDWERATATAKAHPNQAAQWSNREGFFDGHHRSATCLPLHEACLTTAPVETVSAIVRAHPLAVKSAESSFRRLPLHCACRRTRADPLVIRILLHWHRAACLVPDDLGRLPLHYALSNGAEAPVVHALLSAGPAAARGVDSTGWTPLHVATAGGASVAVVRALLELNPEAVVMRTDKGSTPLETMDRSAPHFMDVMILLRRFRKEFDATFNSPLEHGRKHLSLAAETAVYV